MSAAVIRPTVLTGPAALAGYVLFLHDPIHAMQLARRRYGPVCALEPPAWLGLKRRRRVLAMGPVYNREVLGNPDRYHSIPLTVPGPPASAQRRISKGMTALNGEAHDHARASAMKALHKKILERQCEQVGAVVDAVLSSWPLARPLDLWRALTAVPVITSARLLFGIRDAGEACRVGEDVDRWLGANFTLGSRLLRYDWPGFSYRAVLRAADVVESAMKAHIGAYKETADSEVLCHFLDAYGDPGDAAALNEIVRQSVTLFAASYETLVSGLAWTVFLLAQHPPIACDLYDEVDGRLGEGYPTVAQIEHLPLLDAVIKEALRILPPVPYTIRVPAEAVEVGGLALQRGDRIVLSHYVTHHSADLYAEPERFDPRRWERCQPSPYEFLPFSAGPRFCVGYHFAMMVMKVTLAMMLQRYRFRVVPGSRIDRIVRVTLRPKYGMPVVLHPPDRRFERVPVRGAIHEMVSIP